MRVRVLFFAAVCACTVLTTSCVQPLGPGFRFVDRQTEIRAVSDSPLSSGLHVRVVDHFHNTGDRPLRSIEVLLPGEPTFGFRNLRVTVDGREASPKRVSELDYRLLRAQFDPAWEQDQPREIVSEWDLIPESGGRGTIAASPLAFYIADSTILPLWQAPSGVFVRGGPNPAVAGLTVFTLPDFRVIASGKPLKPVNTGNLIAHRFKLGPREDFSPYVVAGRYLEQEIRTPQEVIFWTLQPLDPQQAQAAASRLALSVRAFREFFGSSAKSKAPVRIVETRGDLPVEFGEGDPGGASFPDGVLLDHRAFEQGIATDATIRLAEYELARTWFGWRVQPLPEAQLLMGRGVGLFSLVVAAEARGPDDRRRTVAFLLERYDQARRDAVDRPMVEPSPGYSRDERVATSYRAALFLVALEDLCGHDNLRQAFRQIVRARGGDNAGVEDLRAAVESTSHRDLAEMFRAWLNRSGIPDDFRSRYISPSASRSGN